MTKFYKCCKFERSYDSWKILFYGKSSRLKLNYTINSLNSSQSFKKKLKKNCLQILKNSRDLRYSEWAYILAYHRTYLLIRKFSSKRYAEVVFQEVFCKKGVLQNFAKFTGKHLSQSFFLIKFQAWGLVVLALCNSNLKFLSKRDFPFLNIFKEIFLSLLYFS